MTDLLLTTATYGMVITAIYAAALSGMDWLLTNWSMVRRFLADAATTVGIVIPLLVRVTPMVTRLVRQYVTAQRQIRSGGTR